MHGYAHVVMIGRAEAITPNGFIINANIQNGDRFKRYPFFVLGPRDSRVVSGDWLLVAGQLGNDQRIVAREVLVLSGAPAGIQEPPQKPSRSSTGVFEQQEIALDGYWQARRGVPVWVRNHKKMILKKRDLTKT